MRWQAQQTYPSDRSAPGQARRFCTEQLESVLGHAAAETVKDAALVLSELVTNAINAGCSSAIVDVVVDPIHVRLSVRDDAPGVPQARHPTAEELSGRGLRVIDQLSVAWGVLVADDGKLVWAELAVPGPTT